MKIFNVIIGKNDAPKLLGGSYLHTETDEYGNTYVKNNLAHSNFKLAKRIYNDKDFAFNKSEHKLNDVYPSEMPMVLYTKYEIEPKAKAVINRKNFNINIVKADDNVADILIMLTIDSTVYSLKNYFVDKCEIINTYRNGKDFQGCSILKDISSDECSIKLVLEDITTGEHRGVNIKCVENEQETTLVNTWYDIKAKSTSKSMAGRYLRARISSDRGIPTDAIIVNTDKCILADEVRQIPNKFVIPINSANVMDELNNNPTFKAEMNTLLENKYRAITFIDCDKPDISFYKDYRILYGFGINSITGENVVIKTWKSN